jgi:(E)-4-hydroxy-3-methylbut-2-enyl-diphosphate synthase
MDVSIIGCVVNGPGEAEVSDIGLTGARNMSGYYVDGQRQKERLSNDDLVDQLEKRIRAKAAQIDQKNQIQIKLVN